MHPPMRSAMQKENRSALRLYRKRISIKIISMFGMRKKSGQSREFMAFFLSCFPKEVLHPSKSRSKLGTGKGKKPLKRLEVRPFGEFVLFPMPALARLSPYRSNLAEHSLVFSKYKSPEVRSGLSVTYLVEAMGIEPMSGDPSTETSTCVVGLLDLAILHSDRQDHKVASLKGSHPSHPKPSEPILRACCFGQNRACSFPGQAPSQGAQARRKRAIDPFRGRFRALSACLNSSVRSFEPQAGHKTLDMEPLSPYF